MTNEAHVEGHGEHPPTSIREYVMIGLMLTVVTAVELWASYNIGILGSLLIPVLFVLSAFKFAVVVAMFMHLRFENALLTRLFSFGLILAVAMMIAMTALFWNDATDAVGGHEATPAHAEGAAAPAGAKTAAH